jgi:hypothetical protein
MKRQTEMVEGPEAWKRFEGAMGRVLAIPHFEVKKITKERRRKVANARIRRRPRRKSKPSALPDV